VHAGLSEDLRPEQTDRSKKASINHARIYQYIAGATSIPLDRALTYPQQFLLKAKQRRHVSCGIDELSE
jgi:hypothetical protein